MCVIYDLKSYVCYQIISDLPDCTIVTHECRNCNMLLTLNLSNRLLTHFMIVTAQVALN